MEGLLGNPVIQGLLGGGGPMGVRAQSQQQLAQMMPRGGGGMIGAPSAPAPDRSGADAIASLGDSVASFITHRAEKNAAKEAEKQEIAMLTGVVGTLPEDLQTKVAPMLQSASGRKMLMGLVGDRLKGTEMTTSNTALFDVDGKPRRMPISEGAKQGLAEWQDAPEVKTFGNDVVGYYTVTRGADGKPVKEVLVPGLGRAPTSTPAPQTVRLESGVHILNRDGTLGAKLGDPEPRPQDDLARAKLDDRNQAKRTQSINSYEDISTTIRQAELVLNHPGREAGTGLSSWQTIVPGSDAKGFAAQLETLKAQVFLPQVEKMKGNGSLSDAEGKKLSAAFAALDPNMPEEEFKRSLETAISDLRRAQERERKRLPADYSDPFAMSSGGNGNAPELNVLIDKYAGEQ